ncbi:MAG: hypothetical protein ACXWW6_07580 [Candidatus Limnocylindrales bacterium]
MDRREEATVHPDNDFFVVRERIAEGHARARAENLTHRVPAADPARGSGRLGGARAWLGRRLVAVGTVVAGDPPATEPRSTTGQPC